MIRILAAILLIIVGCGKFEGTGTGNPYREADYGDTNPAEAMGKVVLTTCQRISVCQNDETLYMECRRKVVAHTTWAEKVGISTLPAPSVAEIWSDEMEGKYKPTWTAANTCLEQIMTLSCMAPEVQAAYAAGAPDPFSAAGGMLPSDCQKIFAP